MTKLISIVLLIVPLLGDSHQSLSKKERRTCSSYLYENLASIEKLTKNLSEEQLQFRPGDDQWSLKDNIEHLLKVEGLVRGIVNKALVENKVAGPSLADDKEIRPAMAVRTESSPKYKAPEHIQPRQIRTSFAETFALFREARNETINYVKTTEDDLRGHFAKHPLFKVIDGYQYLIFMGAHTERHILQMEAIVNHHDFPGK